VVSVLSDAELDAVAERAVGSEWNSLQEPERARARVGVARIVGTLLELGWSTPTPAEQRAAAAEAAPAPPEPPASARQPRTPYGAVSLGYGSKRTALARPIVSG
jgi:hypothetical protein